MRTITALLFSFFAAAPALANHPGYDPTRPAVVVHVDAFSPYYRPPVRAGYVWVDGYYDAWGGWVPGYYQPVSTRPGYSWVPGYWAGNAYVAGYWRPTVRSGYYWAPGYYNGRSWVAGSWSRGVRPSTVHYVRSAPTTRSVHYTRPNPSNVVRRDGSRPATRPATRGSSRPDTGPSRRR